MPTFLVATLIQSAVLAGIAAGLGLWLGPKVALGAPDLRGLLHGRQGGGRRVLSTLPMAVGVGVALGCFCWRSAPVSRPYCPRGVAFGWLCWKRGLVAAVTAHIAADIVLHVIAPAVGVLVSA